MYYKLLNKTILTAAMITMMGATVSSVCAQEIIFEDADTDISLPAPENKIPPVVEENDIIPLENQGLISPEPVKPLPQKAPVMNPPQIVPPAQNNPANSGDIIMNDDFSLNDDTIQAPAQENANPVILPQNTNANLPNKQAEQPLSAPQVNNTLPQPMAEQAAPQVQQPQPARPNPAERANKRPQGAKNVPAQNNIKTAPSKDHQAPLEPKFGDSVLEKANNELFSQMSDIEKQTTLLTLELKREKILNEVEAAKAVRVRAEEEKKAMEEAKKRQEEEWKKEQEAKVIREQIALKQKEIELEKVRQRKALTAYMNSMLEQKQMWIEENGKLYDEIERLRQANKEIRASYKSDMDKLSEQTSQLKTDAETAKSNHDRIVASLTAQNAQLKKRIEADAEAARRGNQNPFAAGSGENGEGLSTSADSFIKPINIAKEYAIMEITGKGDELFVKLINKAGDSFVAKVGTVLQTGHMIEAITPNYVQFDKGGLKDFLYTSASALEAEPNNEGELAGSLRQESERQGVPLIGEQKIPSMADSMFVK